MGFSFLLSINIKDNDKLVNELFKSDYGWSIKPVQQCQIFE